MSYNPLYKLFYKIFNKNKYLDIKNKNRAVERTKYYNSHIYNKIVEIQKRIENNKELYEEFFERRGVPKITHYRSPQWPPLTAKVRGKFTTQKHTWQMEQWEEIKIAITVEQKLV